MAELIAQPSPVSEIVVGTGTLRLAGFPRTLCVIEDIAEKPHGLFAADVEYRPVAYQPVDQWPAVLIRLIDPAQLLEVIGKRRRFNQGGVFGSADFAQPPVLA
ncbi:MAG: hypothetical protein OXC25_11075 [Thiotrichales bacterium]|nr:hypothetical protein [Thiotrichales bacterium]